MASSGPGGDLGPALGPGPPVLLLDGLTDGRDPAAEELLGHRELLGAERGQSGVAEGARRRQPARIVASARLPPPGRPGPVARAGPLVGACARAGRGPRPAGASPGTRSAPGARGPRVGGPRSRGAVGALVPAPLELGGEHDVDIRARAAGCRAPRSARRCGPSLLALGGSRAVTVVPSRVVSTSARSTEPTPDPSGTRDRPRPCRAAAWPRRRATSRWTSPV